MQGVPGVQVFKLWIGSFIIHDALNVLKCELVLFLNDLNQGNLVHQVHIIDGATECS